MTATRLPTGGRLINRAKPIEFSFDGKKLAAYEGDTLASALIANDELLVGRSFKYHRPRGVVAAGPEEPNALFGTGVDGRFEPNQRGTTTEVHEGLIATSQNAWPSLAFDIGAINLQPEELMDRAEQNHKNKVTAKTWNQLSIELVFSST